VFLVCSEEAAIQHYDEEQEVEHEEVFLDDVQDVEADEVDEDESECRFEKKWPDEPLACWCRRLHPSTSLFSWLLVTIIRFFLCLPLVY
jgi:hypothetical protein